MQGRGSVPYARPSASQERLLTLWLLRECGQGRAPVYPSQGLAGTVMKSVGSGARPEVSFSCPSLPLLGDWTAPPLPPTHNYSTDYASEQGFVFYQ